MTRDNDVPKADSLAGATRGALLRLAHSVPATRFSWAAVQARAAHVKRTRILTVVSAGLLVLASTTTAFAAVSRDNHDREPVERVATADTSTSATSAPSSSTITTTSNAACVGSCDVVGDGTTTTPEGPAAPAQAADLQGTLTLPSTIVAGDETPYTLTVRNISDHTLTFIGDQQAALGVWVDTGPNPSPGLVGVFNFMLARGEERTFTSTMWANQDQVGTGHVWAALITRVPADNVWNTPSYITGVPSVPVTVVSADPVLPSDGKWTATMSADTTTAHVGETVTVYATVRNVGNGRQATAGYSSLAISCGGPDPNYPNAGQFINGEPFAIGEERTIPFSLALTEDWVGTVSCGFGLASHGDAFAARGMEDAPVTITVLPAEAATTTTDPATSTT